MCPACSCESAQCQRFILKTWLQWLFCKACSRILFASLVTLCGVWKQLCSRLLVKTPHVYFHTQHNPSPLPSRFCTRGWPWHIMVMLNTDNRQALASMPDRLLRAFPESLPQLEAIPCLFSCLHPKIACLQIGKNEVGSKIIILVNVCTVEITKGTGSQAKRSGQRGKSRGTLGSVKLCKPLWGSY